MTKTRTKKLMVVWLSDPETSLSVIKLYIDRAKLDNYDAINFTVNDIPEFDFTVTLTL